MCAIILQLASKVNINSPALTQSRNESKFKRMDPILGRKLAEQNWVNATEKTSRNSKLINDAFKEFREKSQDFYFRLGITSGAILSLSVTFLGYLINSKLEFKFIE